APGLAQKGPALLGERGDVAAPVLLDPPALDEPAALEPVRHPGEAAGRHDAPTRELRHPHPVPACLPQEREHAVLGHAHAEGREALLDLAPDPVVRVEEAPPGLVLEGGEARRRHVGILTVTGPPRGGISACADSYIGRRRCTAAHDPSDRTRETGNRDD